MTMGTTLTFDMPQGWTLRKVTTALARVWLPPFRTVPVAKGAPWMVQPIVDESEGTAPPLWEPGISTEAYEERLEQSGLRWAVRAKAGRSKGTILARLAMSDGHPAQFEIICCENTFPETLFDGAKLDAFLTARNSGQENGLLPTLLIENGFQLAAV